MNPKELIGHLRQTPDMFLRPVTFDTVHSCLIGFDLANGGTCFNDDFHSWLAKKVDPRFQNFAWPGLFLKIAFPEATKLGQCIVDDETDRHAIDPLFDLAEQYFAHRDTGRQTAHNNSMHAKPDLRVQIEVEISVPAR